MVGPAVAGFLAPRAPGVGDRVVRVREEGEPQAVLLVERELLVRLVGRDPDHVQPDPGEVLAVVPYRARLGGASGGVGLRMHHPVVLGTGPPPGPRRDR